MKRWVTAVLVCFTLIGCRAELPQLERAPERVRVLQQPAAATFAAAERVMTRKQARAATVDREGGLARYELPDGTSVTIFVEALSAVRTRLIVTRESFAKTRVDEGVLLDEIEREVSADAR